MPLQSRVQKMIVCFRHDDKSFSAKFVGNFQLFSKYPCILWTKKDSACTILRNVIQKRKRYSEHCKLARLAEWFKWFRKQHPFCECFILSAHFPGFCLWFCLSSFLRLFVSSAAIVLRWSLIKNPKMLISRIDGALTRRSEIIYEFRSRAMNYPSSQIELRRIVFRCSVWFCAELFWLHDIIYGVISDFAFCFWSALKP